MAEAPPSILNPINHASTRAGVQRYKVEPYVMAADVYTEPPHVGRGGWTWYTGSAGWMYQAGVEWILGFRLRGTTLLLDPCIPRAWPGYEIAFRYHSARYEIVVENPQGVSRGELAGNVGVGDLGATLAAARAGVSGELLRTGEAGNVADLGRDAVGEKRADAGYGQKQRDVGVADAEAYELSPALVDPLVELVDHGQARGHGPGPRLGQRQARESLAAGCPEQVSDRELVAEGHERGMDAALQRAPVAYQMEPDAGVTPMSGGD